MKVKIMNRIYEMNKKEYEGLREMASDYVKKGIYCIEKSGYAELYKLEGMSTTKIKDTVRILKKDGWKVYANGLR